MDGQSPVDYGLSVKIYISADMEGVAGVTHPGQCRPSHPDYGRFRRLMTEEVNAAVGGALDAGATEVLVNDSHFTMTNLVIEELHPGASLVSGSNKPLCQMEGLDESYDGVFLVGYHEGDGDGDGVVNHTLMSATIRRVRVNGLVMDEAMINARVAGDFGVPVALLTGDDRVCAAASAAFPGVEVAAVKRAIDRLSAAHRSVESARALIAERAAAAVEKLRRGELEPLTIEGAARFEVEFRATSSAQMCTLFPGVERTGPREIAFEHDTIVEAYRHFWGLGIVAMAVQDGVFGLGI
jgi:D-amino peptidase